MLDYFHIHSFLVSLCKPLRSYFSFATKKRKKKEYVDLIFFLLLVSSFSVFKVKVWFQNRRMKWKRVKGGQQGAAAREKELVNVKKGTLLPSELSGIGAATLQQTGDSLANEDSHDSDHSSEHAHLWYTQRWSAPFSGKECCDSKPYSNSVYTERWLWPCFLILLNSGISSLFFMIYERFYTKCHLLKMIPQWRWTHFDYSRCVSCVYGSEQVCVCFCLHWKLNCCQEQTVRRF